MLCFVGCVAILFTRAAFADIATEWDFNGNLNATFGTGTMSCLQRYGDRYLFQPPGHCARR